MLETEGCYPCSKIAKFKKSTTFTFMEAGSIFLVVVALVLLMMVYNYNKIIKKKNAIRRAESALDTYLKKRFDLIPNLVHIANTSIANEQQLISEISNQHTKLLTQNTENLHAPEFNKIYHDVAILVNKVTHDKIISSNNNYVQLQQTWNKTEEHIAAARRFYNDAIYEYNTTINSFPASMLTNMFKFQPVAYWEIEEEERKNIDAKNLL